MKILCKMDIQSH